MTIKLSDTQDAAIREVAELGYTVAKANTIKSLENKGLITPTGVTHHELTDAGREYLGLPADEAPQDSIMEDTSGVEVPDQVSEIEKPLADWELELLEGAPEVPAKLENTTENPYQYFDEAWNAETRLKAGFGITLPFRNTQVWDGLTAQEIRDDLDTAFVANRAQRRLHSRILGNEFRKVSTSRPRKALKLTGARGL